MLKNTPHLLSFQKRNDDEWENEKHMKLKGAKFRKGKEPATKGVWMWMYPFKIEKVGKLVIIF